MEQEVIQPSAEELVLCTDPAMVCETYLFEPTSTEARLGFLFAAGETESRSGVGKPLLDSIISAIQKEYYRDSSRSSATSFEMALHQANLILHDSVDAGVKDWMGHFHVAVGVLAGSQLHVSVAGAGAVFLARKSVVTNISQGLSHFPITDPLKTFSQVASGTVMTRDSLFFTSSTFDSVFRSVDVGRFSLEHSASTIASRLEQLYLDQDHKVPLSVTVVSLLPQYIATAKQEVPSKRSAQPVGTESANIQPRAPLFVKKSLLTRIVKFAISLGKAIMHGIKTYAWPFLKKSSVQATQKAKTLSVPKISFKKTVGSVSRLPKSSLLFAGIAVILLIALGVSIALLRHKQASDSAIQAASEQLHEARTKVDAANTALIYDNRTQASGLLDDAQKITDQLVSKNLYVQETSQLKQDIQTQQDKIQRIFRATTTNSKVIGNIGSLTSNKTPARIFYIDNALYTANPDTNTIIKQPLDSKAIAVHQTTSGIGFIVDGTMQSSDKTILFNTDPIGLALFDTKDSSLSPQTIAFPNAKPQITTMSVFGNRLYIYDATQKNIFSYNKTLKGFIGGTPWITDANAPKDNIKSFAIDGNLYTLSGNGVITKLFRGAITDFTQAPISPALNSATRIYTSDTMLNLYILDPANKRVVMYTKKGALVRQLYIDTAKSLSDITVSPDETHLYALDGTDILDVSLTDGSTASPTPAP
ncbi:MAG: hypothetical protein ABIP54_00660 [Candidatus Andersenbacteria bacterium]